MELLDDPLSSHAVLYCSVSQNLDFQLPLFLFFVTEISFFFSLMKVYFLYARN